MSDEQAVIDAIADAWEATDVPQTRFAAILRDEADVFETAPEEATAPGRVTEWSDVDDARPSITTSAAVLELRQTDGSAKWGLDADESRDLAALLREGVYRHEDGEQVAQGSLRTAEDVAKSLDRVADAGEAGGR